MFATKKCLINWCNDYLKRENGQYLCPVTNQPLTLAHEVGNGWRIKGKSEEWLWKIEDLKG